MFFKFPTCFLTSQNVSGDDPGEGIPFKEDAVGHSRGRENAEGENGGLNLHW